MSQFRTPPNERRPRVQATDLRLELDDPAQGFNEGTMALHAWLGDERVGWMAFCDFGDRLWIRWIEVFEGQQGRGIANLLMDEARRRYHLEIATGGFADDHAKAWWDNYRDRHWKLPETREPILSNLDASAEPLPNTPAAKLDANVRPQR